MYILFTGVMDCNVEFNSAYWDEEHEISTLHLSFLIQTLLPLHTVKWDVTKRHYLSINADIEEKFAGVEELHCIATGSMAEGYSIPSSVCRSETTKELYNKFLSDVDILTVFSKLKMSTDDEISNSDETDFKGYFEYIDKRPGYVHICLLNPKAEDDIFIIDDKSGKYYLSGIKLMDKLFSVIQDHQEATKQGPAVTITDKSMVNKLKLEGGVSTDLVFALPCSPWPSIANNWKARADGSLWLTSDLVQSTINDGCHIVAVPSKMSPNPELEWRISFSASEGRLAREAVTDHQRQCFIFIKILHQQKIKPKGMLSSYMFKSVFLHCCEKLPVSHWKNYPGSCILYILDVMLDCLRRKHIPTYFLPQNNLISHLSETEIKENISLVERVRKDPVTPVLEFTDKGIFSRHSTYISFRQMVEPLLEDMKAFKNHKDSRRSILNGIIGTGYKICLFFLAEQSEDTEAALFKHQEGIRHLVNIYNFWLRQISQPPNLTLTQFMNSSGLKIKNNMRALRFFEAAISLSGEYPEFMSLRGNLASLYHGSAYLSGLSADMKELYLVKAEKLFKVVYEQTGDSAIDYVVFLVKLNRLKEAKGMIEKFLDENKVNAKTDMNVFDMKEKECLVEPLKKHIESHGEIAGDSVSFAYFYLVYCNKSDNVMYTDHAVKALAEFEQHYSQHSEKDTLVLLNYAKSL